MKPVATRVVDRFLQATVATEHATPEAREKYLKGHPKADPSKHTVKKDVKFVPKRHPKEVADEVMKLSPKEVQDEAGKLKGESKKKFDEHVEALSKNKHMPAEKVQQYALLEVRSGENYERVETERGPKAKK